MKLDDGKNFVPAQGPMIIPAKFVMVDDVIACIDNYGVHEGRVRSIETGKSTPFVYVYLYQWRHPKASEDMEMSDETNLHWLKCLSLRIEASGYKYVDQVRWLGRWETPRSAL